MPTVRALRNYTTHVKALTFRLDPTYNSTIKSGAPFKIATTQADASSDILDVLPAGAGDPVHGIVRPHERIGANADTFSPGDTFQGTLTGPFICPIVAGGTLAKGDEVYVGTNGAFIKAPSFVQSGATLVQTAGIVLRAAGSGDGTELYSFPRTYTTT